MKSDQSKNSQWLQPIANPNDKQQYYLADKSGKIYIAQDGEINPQPIFNLSKINHPKNPQDIVLTSIILHPDFAFRDQVGYGTFYTAHTSKIESKSKTKRLQVRQADIDYQYDAIITEWQFNQLNHTKIDLSSKREIVRISLLNQVNSINQLAFNPFKKSWNDDYGLLYFSLLQEDKLSTHPLYSGAILRIQPKLFGRKNYTTPTNNPFLKDTQINDEIYLVGAQHIQQFLWPQKNSAQLAVLHRYNKENTLSTTGLRNDWRINSPKVQQPIESDINNILLYQGRNILSLRKSLLYLKQSNEQWILNSVQLSDQNSSSQVIQTNLDSTEFPITNDLLMFTDSFGELLLLDKTNSIILKIFQENSAKLTDDEVQDESSFGIFFFFIIIITFSLFIVVKSKKGKKGLSSLVQRNYAHIEVSQSKHQVGLFRRHQTTSETIINIDDILSSEIMLNNVALSLINKDKGHGFSDEQEIDLRENFSREYKDKMIDDKVRQICIALNESEQNHIISLYARKGNQRVTKKKYKDVIEEIIDWCWLVAQTINPDNTGKRTPRATLSSTAPNTTLNKPAVIDNKNNKQEAINKVVAKMNEKTKASTSSSEPSKDSIKPSIQKDQDNNNQNSMVDAELVNALDKLVELKKQGFLTNEEFDKAKSKLLHNLMN